MSVKTYNPLCLVAHLYFKANGKPLYCEECIFENCKYKRVKKNEVLEKENN